LLYESGGGKTEKKHKVSFMRVEQSISQGNGREKFAVLPKQASKGRVRERRAESGEPKDSRNERRVESEKQQK
jgi:hypothetical protein